MNDVTPLSKRSRVRSPAHLARIRELPCSQKKTKRLHINERIFGLFSDITGRAEQLDIVRSMSSSPGKRLYMVNVISLFDGDLADCAFPALRFSYSLYGAPWEFPDLESITLVLLLPSLIGVFLTILSGCCGATATLALSIEECLMTSIPARVFRASGIFYDPMRIHFSPDMHSSGHSFWSQELICRAAFMRAEAANSIAQLTGTREEDFPTRFTFAPTFLLLIGSPRGIADGTASLVQFQLRWGQPHGASALLACGGDPAWESLETSREPIRHDELYTQARWSPMALLARCLWAETQSGKEMP